jgi:Uncharacterized protein conserved in bacteria
MVIDRIEINLQTQICRVVSANQVTEYACSTALNGPGERDGSGCTPRGMHRIRAIIGRGCVPNAVFVGRRPTGEVWTPALHASEPTRDWILGRILWLCGEDVGFNRGGTVDSQRRYIYIHGTPDSEPMGIPRSHGCIRMRMQDVCQVADAVTVGCPVLITELQHV